MKTLKDVVNEHNPEYVNEKYEGGVYNCPEHYQYLKGHYYSSECMAGGRRNCDNCWMQPYLIPYEEKSDRYKNYREKIIEGAKIMQNICKENGLTKNCENCSIYDICSKFDDANLDIGFVPEYIGKLPEV